ncbi:MAG: peptidoglycan-binding protein [Roseiflexaceae bacterium]
MRKHALLWAAAGIAGVLLIIGVVVFLTLAGQSRIYTERGAVDLSHPQPTIGSTAIGTHEPVPTIVNPSPESASIKPSTPPEAEALQTVAPQATDVAPTASPQPILQAASAVFYDDFTDLASGWSPLFLDKSANFNGYSMGGYYFETSQPGGLVYDVENRAQMDAGRYAVDVHYQQGAGTFGLLLGVQGDLNRFDTLSYISVSMTEQGNIVVLRHVSGSEQIIADAPSGATFAGEQKSLRLAVDADDMGIVVIVNDTVALRAPNVQMQNGYVGLFAQSSGQPLRVGFDNLLALAQPPANQPACMSIRALFSTSSEQLPAEGDDVRMLRLRLHHLGYSVSQDQAAFDQTLATAISQFQARNHLPPSSRVDGPTWCRLLSDAAIRADSDQTERAEELQTTRPVQFNAAVLTAPLLVSVRQDDQTWRVALVLPSRNEPRYLELGGDAFDSSWSPDARTLAFTSNRSGRGAVWLLELQSGALRQVTPSDQECQFPAWSPDGRMLIVTCEPLDNAPLAARDFVIDMASGQLRQLSNDHSGWADWSAASEIVFTHWTGKSFDLVRVNSDGSGAINLTNSDDIDEDIAGWSPDGQHVIFVANPRGQANQRQIFVMQRDGSGITQLTSMSGPNSNPIWSPDGQTILFSHMDGTRLQPWILQVGVTQPQQISANDDRVWFMNWVRHEP